MITVHDVWKTYPLGDTCVQALRGVSVRIEPGEFALLLGPSGSGKSSLLHILGAMDRPTRGQLEFQGRDISRLSGREQTHLRLNRIGFIFQTFNLMPTLTALENVALPMRLAGVGRRERLERAQHLLHRVGLGDRGRHLPRQLSGGQRQRVAIARALANEPAVILADEPTGNLDSESGAQVIDILKELHREGRTILMVTHNAEFAPLADRLLRMRDGQLVHEAVSG